MSSTAEVLLLIIAICNEHAAVVAYWTEGPSAEMHIAGMASVVVSTAGHRGAFQTLLSLMGRINAILIVSDAIIFIMCPKG